MILSVHLVEAGPRDVLRALRDQRRVEQAPGLRWVQIAAAVPLGAGVVPPPKPDGAALVAAWDDDAALDAFEASPLAARWAGGFSARLEPLRAYGALAALPGLGRPEQPTDDEEPVLVLTLGTTYLRRAVPFFRASAPAERQAVSDPAFVLGAGLARPPRFIGTCSLWRTAREMRAYATTSAEGHAQAMEIHAAKPFHRESAFVRFRPTAVSGTWRGRAPSAPSAPALADQRA